jgi:hypothetical protein
MSSPVVLLPTIVIRKMSNKKTCGGDENSLFEVDQLAIFERASGGIMRRYHLGKLWI